jgi:hypothetical protein
MGLSQRVTEILETIVDALGNEDCGNSTNALLEANGVFTGEKTEILTCDIVFVNVYSDVASATDGLVVQQSTDGINWDHDDKYTISAATGKNFSFNTYARYMRVIYTNGSTAQSEFRLQTICKRNAKPSSHRVQDNIIDDDDAELVKSVLTGKANGTYKNVRTTIDGDLKISDNSSGIAIAKGDVTGASFIHKFGNAPDFDTGDGEVTIWDGAEDNTDWELMRYVYSTTADIDSISSSDDTDTQEIVIEGLDANWDVVIQTKTLTGQTRAALDTSLIRVYRAYNNNSTDLLGHVIIYVNGEISGGVPTTAANIRAVIDPVNQQTEMAVYTIPAGKTGYMRDWYASTSGSNRDANYPIKLYSREFGKIFRLKHVSSVSDTATSSYQHKYESPEVFTEKTDIEMTAQMLAVGASEASISGGFDIDLFDN